MTTEKDQENTQPAVDIEASGPVAQMDAGAVIERFGGIRPMAAKLDIAVTTVQGWKNRGAIPESRYQAILDAAAEHDVDLTDVATGPEPSEDSEDKNTEAAVASSEPKEKTETHEPLQVPKAPPPATAKGYGLALGLGAAALVLALTQPLWSPIIYGDTTGGGDLIRRVDALETKAGDDQSIRRLQQQYAQLEGELKSARAAVQNNNDNMSDLNSRIAAMSGQSDERGALGTALTKRLEDQESGLVTLRQALSAAAAENEQLKTALKNVQAQTAELQQRLSNAVESAASVGPATALNLALSNLESILLSDQPFAGALQAVRQTAAEEPKLLALLDRIDSNANAGIPTLPQLTRQFEKLAPELARQAAVGGRTDWIGKIKNKVYDVVSWRQVGGPVDQALTALENRDLAGAINALTPLNEQASVWLAEARARMAAQAVLNDIRARAIDAVLAPKPGAAVN